MEGDQCYFDAHNHLLDYSEAQLDLQVKEAIKHRVLLCAPNSTRQEEYSRMLNLAKTFPLGGQGLQIIPSFGVHPYFLQHQANNPHWYDSLREVIATDQRFCVGEIGIDHRKGVLAINSKEIQQEFFIKQLELSFLANRTVTVHCVRAHGQLLKMLKRYHKLFSAKEQIGLNEQERELRNKYGRNPIIMHSYGGSKEITQSLLKLTTLNIFFSLCLNRSQDLCGVIPVQQLILETDAPYQNNLSLLKHQGLFEGDVTPEIQKEQEKKNCIHYVRANIGSLCGYYQLDRHSFSKIIFQNTLRAFRLAK